MKISHSSKIVVLLTLLFLMFPTYEGHAQTEYAKWSKVAISETNAQYPDYNLKDYSYDGKVVISEEREQYTFSLTLEKDGKNQKVKVYVLINPKTKEKIDVFFDEIE